MQVHLATIVLGDGDGGSDGKDDEDPIFYQNLRPNQIKFEPNLNLMW